MTMARMVRIFLPLVTAIVFEIGLLFQHPAQTLARDAILVGVQPFDTTHRQIEMRLVTGHHL